MDTDTLIKLIIDCAITVKRALGQGFVENVYRNALAVELQLHGLEVLREVPLTVTYKGHDVGFYRADLLIDNRVIVETKVAETIDISFECQLVNYLRATGINDGLLINFGTFPLGIKRKFRECKI